MIPETTLLDLVERALQGSGLEIVSVRFPRKRMVTVTIDREPEPVDVHACGRASRLIQGMLTAEDEDAALYTIEVESPGLDRLLTRDKDLVRFAGKRVRVRLREPFHDKETYTGSLEGHDPETVTVRALEGDVRLPRTVIREIRLVPGVP